MRQPWDWTNDRPILAPTTSPDVVTVEEDFNALPPVTASRRTYEGEVPERGSCASGHDESQAGEPSRGCAHGLEASWFVDIGGGLNLGDVDVPTEPTDQLTGAHGAELT